MTKLQQIALSAIISLGCQEIGWTIQECSPEMKEYIAYSSNIISRYQDAMVDEIEKNVDQSLQDIPPQAVFDYLFSDGFDLECGIPDDLHIGIGVFFYHKDDNRGLIILSSPYFQQIYEQSVKPYEIFLNEDGTFNFEVAKNFIKNDTDLYDGEGFNKSYEANFSSTSALAQLVDTLIHEATHGTWRRYGLSSHHRCKNHTCEEEAEQNNDPFFQYGFKASDVIRYKVSTETSNKLNHMAFENYMLQYYSEEELQNYYENHDEEK